MLRRHKMAFAMAAIGCLFAAALCAEEPAGPAAPPAGVGVRADQIVPSDCVVFLELADVSRSIERLKSSPIGKIYAEKEVQQFLAEPLKKLSELVQQRQARAQLDFITMSSAFKGQVAVALLGVRPGENEPMPEIVVIAEAKDAWRNEIESVITGLLGRLREMAPELAVQEYQYGPGRVKVLPVGEVELAWTFVGDLMVGGLGRANVEKLLDNLGEKRGEVLADNPAYKAVKDSAGKKPDFLAFGSGSEMVKKFEGLIGEGDLEEMAAIGIPQTKGAAYALSCGPAGVREALAIHSPEKKGVLKLFDQEPVKLDGLKHVPERALAYIALKLSPEKTMEAFIELVGELDEAEEAEQIRAEMKKLEEMLKINIREQIYDSVSGEVQAYLAFPPMGGAIWPDIVLMLELKDPKPFGEFVNAIQLFTAAQMGGGAAEAPQRFFQFPYGERTVHYVKTGDGDSPIAPAWCVTEKYLVVTSGPPAMKRALRALDKEVGLNASETFVATTKRMSKDSSMMIYLDTAAAFNFGYNSGVAFLQNKPKLEASGIDPNLLPLAETISQHLKGWAITFGTTKETLFFESSGPLPVLPTIITLAAGVDQVQRAERRARRQERMRQQEDLRRREEPVAPPAVPNGEGGDIF